MTYFDAATLQEVFADVSAVVFHRVLVDELLGHDGPFLLEASNPFPLLGNQHSKGSWELT